MIHKRTIKLYLLDGDPNGRITCELSNWTGMAYKIPRTSVKKCGDRPDLNSPGVYFLFGEDENEIPRAYIGEAESVIKRLSEHVEEKEFWYEAIVFISKDGSLNKARVKYLENWFYLLAKEAGRYILENRVIPTASSLTEMDIAEMEEYAFHAKILIAALGRKIFEELYKEDKQKKGEQQIFYFKGARGAEGRGLPASDGFVVLKDSICANSTLASMSQGYASLRKKLIEEQVIEELEGEYVFNQDYLFNSPSVAAEILAGRSANGRTEWLLADGTSLKEVERLG